MKTLFLALAMVLSLVRLDAATLNLDGDLAYNITEPRLSLKLKGTIQNTGPSTGTLKLVLYATKNPFPSAGYVVGEHTIGSLPSGYQFTSFTVKTSAKLPVATGNYYFTVTIAEYTASGWKNVLAEDAGSQRIVSGDIFGQKKWTLPTDPVLPPLGKLKAGMLLKLRLKATGDMNLFPNGYQDKIAIDIKSKKKLESTLRSVTDEGEYTLKVKDGKYNKKKVTYNSLSIDYGSSTVTLSLYFQDTSSGTYKSVESSSSGKETTWGTFEFQ